MKPGNVQLVLCQIEGTVGRTPGKWILGIKVVGTDLRPCGFGRALIRNVLKFVDGFFNFMVGVLVVAFNENWQRVGDMAARTVVLDVRSQQSTSASVRFADPDEVTLEEPEDQV